MLSRARYGIKRISTYDMMRVRFISNKDWEAPDLDASSADYVDFAAFVHGCVQKPFVGVRFALRPANGDLLWMACDARTTAPIYYKQEAAGYVLGSTGWDILQASDIVTPDEDAHLFYRRWGITHRDHTLYKEVRRVPPSAAVRILADGRTELRYYDEIDFPLSLGLLPRTDRAAQEALSTLFDQMALRIVERAQGKRVILPLTGGRDSRLLACCLKRAGVEDVLCLTYGKSSDNTDLSKARIIAQRLGYKHRYIPSVSSDLPASSYMYDEDFLRFACYMAGLGSCYFYQEYQPARTLQAEGLLENGLVLTGHNGDILGGGLLVYPRMDRSMSDCELGRMAMLHGYTHTHLSRIERRQLSHLHTQLIREIRVGAVWQKFEIHQCREFVSKYYTNSGRSWRYFGAELYHPYVDLSLIRFAHSLPFVYRYGKRIYDELTDTLFARMGVDLAEDSRQIYTQCQPLYGAKMWLRPHCAPYLFGQKHFGEEAIGFDQLMQPLADVVRRDGRYHPASFNGLSFAWYLLNLERFANL